MIQLPLLYGSMIALYSEPLRFRKDLLVITVILVIVSCWNNALQIALYTSLSGN